MSALFEEPPSKKRRIQILNVTEAATIRVEATRTKSAVELSNCAICQEDDAPMDTVFTGCGHVSTCMSCTLRLVSDFNGHSLKTAKRGARRAGTCRSPSRLRASERVCESVRVVRVLNKFDSEASDCCTIRWLRLADS